MKGKNKGLHILSLNDVECIEWKLFCQTPEQTALAMTTNSSLSPRNSFHYLSFLSFSRQKIEELAQKVAVERTRREEESRRLEAEQAREREEQLRCQAEEQARREREEMERLQKQVAHLSSRRKQQRAAACLAEYVGSATSRGKLAAYC